MTTFRQRTKIAVPASQLEQWHHRAGAFGRLTPPWEKVRIIQEPETITDGSQAIVELKQGPFWGRWIAEHRDCRPGEGFTDVQVKGPFAAWTHHHRFLKEESDESVQSIKKLIQLFDSQDNLQIVAKMKEIVPEFISNNSTFEQLDK